MTQTQVANSNGASVIWQSYVDVDNDLKPWLQLPTTETAATDRKLTLIAEQACQWVQNFLGRPIAPTTLVRRFNGWSGWTGSYIMLPYYPVLEVVEVIEYRGNSGAYVLDEQTPTNQVDGWNCDYQAGMLTRTFPGLAPKPWFPGNRNIEVTWTAGYNPVPADVMVATLEMAAHWWRSTQQAARSNVRGGGDDDNGMASGIWPGVPNRIKEQLSTYVRIGIG